MIYGFDKMGGFVVLDTDRRLWLYSYPTSPNAEIAKHNPASAAKIKAMAFDGEARLLGCQSATFKHHYLAQYDELLGRLIPSAA